MTVHDTELFDFPLHDLTGIEEFGGRRRVRDALVARLDGYRPLHIDVDIPPAAAPVPVVAWIHGGAWQWGSNKLQDGPVPSRQIRERLLENGIAFAAVDYRLAAEAAWPAPLHDVKAAIRWLRHYAPRLGLDPDRIAVWGESAGGHLAALVATTSGHRWDGALGVGEGSSDVIACVDWYGPADLVELIGSAAREPVLALLGQDVGAAADASPIAHADRDSAPLLLIHGDADSIVPVEQSLRFAEAYRSCEADVELHVVPGAGHAFAGTDPEEQIPVGIDFLRRVFAR